MRKLLPFLLVNAALYSAATWAVDVSVPVSAMEQFLKDKKNRITESRIEGPGFVLKQVDYIWGDAKGGKGGKATQTTSEAPYRFDFWILPDQDGYLAYFATLEQACKLLDASQIKKLTGAAGMGEGELVSALKYSIPEKSSVKAEDAETDEVTISFDVDRLEREGLIPKGLKDLVYQIRMKKSGEPLSMITTMSGIVTKTSFTHKLDLDPTTVKAAVPDIAKLDKKTDKDFNQLLQEAIAIGGSPAPKKTN